MHPEKSRSSKIPLAWIVVMILFILSLSIGCTYGRLIDWSSIEVVYTPDATGGYSSDCLVSGGHEILLADWQPEEEQRIVEIAVRRPETAVAPDSAESSSDSSSGSVNADSSAASASMASSQSASSSKASSKPASSSEASSVSNTAPSAPAESGAEEDLPGYDAAEVTVTLDEAAGTHLMPGVQVTQDAILLALDRRVQAEGLAQATPLTLHVSWHGLEATLCITMLPYEAPVVEDEEGRTADENAADSAASKSTGSTAANSGSASRTKSNSAARTAESSSQYRSNSDSVPQSGSDSVPQSGSDSASQSASDSASQSASGNSTSGDSSQSVSGDSASGSSSAESTPPESEREIVPDLELLEYNAVIDPTDWIAGLKLNLETLADFTVQFCSLDTATGEKHPLQKVRYSLDGGESYKLLFDTDRLSLPWPYAEGWDGTVLLDFGHCLPDAHRPVITVSAQQYTVQELHPTPQAAPSLEIGLVKSSKMPYNVTIPPLWGGAQLRVNGIERLVRSEEGTLAYEKDSSIRTTMTEKGFLIENANESVYPIPGSYRLHLLWDWYGLPVRAQTVYFFVNAN